MKKYEHKLLARLGQNHWTPSEDEPLKNIKKALGEVAFVKGNPLTKTEISIQITTEFLIAGVVTPPAALPVVLQNTLPVYLFSLTDFYGGFNNSRRIIPVNINWTYIIGGIIGYQGFAVPPGAWVVPIVAGDMVFYYQSTNPALFGEARVIIHCNNVSYGTFLNSFVSDLITISVLRNIIPIANINQFINVLIFSYQTLFGKTNSDSIDPRMYITPTEFQEQICDIPINLPIDKNIMLGFQLDVFCQQYSIILFVQKVEPLTHSK